MSNIKEEDLKNVNGGSWGYLYNSGDCYWKGQKVSMTEANAIVHFTNDRGYQPDTLEEALKYSN